VCQPPYPDRQSNPEKLRERRVPFMEWLVEFCHLGVSLERGKVTKERESIQEGKTKALPIMVYLVKE
jgi:hypothetical protein